MRCLTRVSTASVSDARTSVPAATATRSPKASDGDSQSLNVDGIDCPEQRGRGKVDKEEDEGIDRQVKRRCPRDEPEEEVWEKRVTDVREIQPRGGDTGGGDGLMAKPRRMNRALPPAITRQTFGPCLAASSKRRRIMN